MRTRRDALPPDVFRPLLSALNEASSSSVSMRADARADARRLFRVDVLDVDVVVGESTPIESLDTAVGHGSAATSSSNASPLPRMLSESGNGGVAS